MSRFPVVIWRSARGTTPTANASACGQYSSVTFSASWRVVTTLGGSPVAEVRSITTSSRPSSTAYLYVAVNAPSSDRVRHRGARRHRERSIR